MIHCSHTVIMNLIQSETRETEILRNSTRLQVKCYISISFRDLLRSLFSFEAAAVSEMALALLQLYKARALLNWPQKIYLIFPLSFQCFQQQIYKLYFIHCTALSK